MKFIVMGFLMSLATTAGCMNAPDSAPASGDEPQQSEEQSEIAQPRGPQCTARMGTCETGSFCRRVGINIGQFDCSAGLICCV
ncbi:MAG TPA: hypothetical protein VHW23_21045 [Kofleriaceae bacterium]|jgi:hypothetical protein|nr:hypothetical protein [Kofleriaceae bacterium]